LKNAGLAPPWTPEKLFNKQTFLGVRDHGTLFSKRVLVAEGIALREDYSYN